MKTFCAIPLLFALLAGPVWAQTPDPPAPVIETSPDMALTPRQHFQRFTSSLFGWDTLYMPLVTVVPDQTLSSHDGYPDGIRGFADNYKDSLFGAADGKFIRHFLFPTAFRQDESYEPLPAGAPVAFRVRHALAHILITRSDDHTRNEFNMEGIPAAFASAYTQIPLQPATERTASATLGNVASTLGFRILGDLITEFSPEIHRLLP